MEEFSSRSKFAAWKDLELLRKEKLPYRIMGIILVSKYIN
jgi:hypothetical protein